MTLSTWLGSTPASIRPVTEAPSTIALIANDVLVSSFEFLLLRIVRNTMWCVEHQVWCRAIHWLSISNDIIENAIALLHVDSRNAKCSAFLLAD